MADAESSDPGTPGRRERGPSGEGWDDGKGNRPRRTRSSRGSSSAKTSRPKGRPDRNTKPDGSTKEGLLQRLPKWAFPAGAAVLLLLVVIVFLLSRGGGSSDAGSCLSDLSANLPASSKTVFGTDLVQARGSDYDDGGTLEDLGDSQRTSGALPDALTQQFRYGRLISAEDFKALTGVESKTIQCSLSTGSRAVMSGSFTPAEVNNSSAANDGLLAGSEDRLGLVTGDADPARLLEPLDGGGLSTNDDAVGVVESLRDGGAYSILVSVGDRAADRKARAAGFGVAKADSGEDKALVVAWSFGSEKAAQAGRTQVVERVNDALEGLTSISVSDLEVDGTLVRAKIATRKAPDLLRLLNRGVELIPTDS